MQTSCIKFNQTDAPQDTKNTEKTKASSSPNSPNSPNQAYTKRFECLSMSCLRSAWTIVKSKLTQIHCNTKTQTRHMSEPRNFKQVKEALSELGSNELKSIREYLIRYQAIQPYYLQSGKSYDPRNKKTIETSLQELEKKLGPTRQNIIPIRDKLLSAVLEHSSFIKTCSDDQLKEIVCEKIINSLTTQQNTEISSIRDMAIELQLDRFSPMPMHLLLDPLKNYFAEQIQSLKLDFLKFIQWVNTLKPAENQDETFSISQTIAPPGSGKTKLYEPTSVIFSPNKPSAEQAKKGPIQLDFDYHAMTILTAFNQFLKSNEESTKDEILIKRYDTLRGLSQVMHNLQVALILSKKINCKLSITSTNKFFQAAVDKMTEFGAQFTFDHITTPLEIRQQSIKQRLKDGIYQCDPKDFTGKANTFFDMTSTYLQQKGLKFWYRDCVNGPPVLAAEVTQAGEKIIYDPKKLKTLIEVHKQESAAPINTDQNEPEAKPIGKLNSGELIEQFFLPTYYFAQ